MALRPLMLAVWYGADSGSATKPCFKAAKKKKCFILILKKIYLVIQTHTFYRKKHFLLKCKEKCKDLIKN